MLTLNNKISIEYLFIENYYYILSRIISREVVCRNKFWKIFVSGTLLSNFTQTNL